MKIFATSDIHGKDYAVDWRNEGVGSDPLTKHAWEITIEMPPDPIAKKRSRTTKTVNGTKKRLSRSYRI